MGNLKLAVPAGIGDVSWIWSKFCHMDCDFEIYTPDTFPQRTFEWLKLLPRVTPKIGKHGYNDLLTMENLKGYASYDSWDRILKAYEEGEIIYLQPNQHFLAGRDLRDWLPDLPTEYHYNMIIPKETKLSGVGLLGLRDGEVLPKFMGIHMSSMKGIRGWEAWLPEDWVKFLQFVHKDFPDVEFIFLGGLWDQDTGLEVQGLLEDTDIMFNNLIGRTSIGEAITILSLLKYYVGFSSGLNVMCNVLKIPCTALWPQHHKPHIYPHSDPEMVMDQTYLGFTYDEPHRIYTRIRSVLRRKECLG